MEKFSFGPEKYKLELHWAEAIYNTEGVCDLKEAYFSGPALADAEKVQDNDYIMLDFYSQYLVLVSNVYVGKLSWGKVTYSGRTIKLSDAKITHDTELNKVPKLGSKDYLLIDTSNHERELHNLNLLYKTYVVNELGELYNFRS